MAEQPYHMLCTSTFDLPKLATATVEEHQIGVPTPYREGRTHPTTHLWKAAETTPRLLALRLKSGSISVSEDAVALVQFESLTAWVMAGILLGHSQDTA